MDIKSLKDKILQLAIQGKLVPQDENDEPASILLDLMKTEKEQIIKEKGIRKEKVLPEITEEEKRFDIPKGWEWSRLPNVTIFQEGPGILAKDFREDGIPLIRLSGMQTNVVSLDGCNYLDECMVKKKWEHFKLDLGDIIVSSSASMGKVARVDSSTVGCIPYTGLIRFKVLSGIFDKYFIYFMQSPDYMSQIDAQKSGTTIKHYGPTHLKKMIIPVPPLEEQKRIVAKVDELFELIDELDNNKQELLENISNTRNKVLQLAIQGKLVEQCEDDEPASVLLERIKAEKDQLIKDKVIKKEKPLPEISEEEKSFDLPKSWEWCRLGHISTIKGGKRIPSGKKLLDEPTEHMYIRISDMKSGTIIENDIKYISDEIYEQIKNYYIEKDDIYMTIAGTIGRVGIIPDKFHMAILTENASKIRVYNVYKDFIFRILDSQYIQTQISNRTKKVGQPKLALNQIASLIIPLPPLEEQKRIVKKVDLIMNYLDTLQQEIESQEIILEDIIN